MEDNNNFAQVPFLTREMLKFGSDAKFELSVTTISVAAVSVPIRGITRSGVISAKHTGTANSQLATSNFQIDDIPTMITVAPLAAGFVHGSVYASLSLRINEDIVFTLVSGFLTTAKGLSWPNSNLSDPMPGHGMIELKTFNNPSAGANLSSAITPGETWRVLYGGFDLVTNATAASRRVHVGTEVAATRFIVSWGNTDQLASTTKSYELLRIGSIPVEEASNRIIIPIPDDLWLRDLDTFEIEVKNKQAGDQLSTIVLMVEKFFKGAN